MQQKEKMHNNLELDPCEWSTYRCCSWSLSKSKGTIGKGGANVIVSSKIIIA